MQAKIECLGGSRTVRRAVRKCGRPGVCEVGKVRQVEDGGRNALDLPVPVAEWVAPRKGMLLP